MKLYHSILFILMALIAGAKAYASSWPVEYNRPARLEATSLDCNKYSDLCESTVRWRSSAYQAVLTIAERGKGNREALLACTTEGVRRIDRVHKSQKLVVRLYENIPCPNVAYPNPYQLGRESARVEIKRKWNDDHSGWPNDDYGYSQARLDASPLRPIAPQLFSTTIQWQTSQKGMGIVTVSVPTSNNPGEVAEKLFACGMNGIQNADWIRAHDKYVFKLYEGASCPKVSYPNKHQLGREVRRIVVQR